MSVEDHLLGLPRVCHHQKMPAVAQPQLGRLHRDRHPCHLYQLMAPVELEGFSRLEHQRNVNLGGKLALAPPPIPHMAPDTVIAARIAFGLQLLEKNNRTPALPLGKLRILRQCLRQSLYIRPQNRERLRLPMIPKYRLLTPNRLPDRVPGNPQLLCSVPNRTAIPMN